jgi:hypothetical protein
VKVVDWLLTLYQAEGYQFETIPSMMSRLRPSPAPSDPAAPPET